MTFPFEVTFQELQDDIGSYVDAVFSCLGSEFMIMPKGKGFIDYPTFENGYEALKKGTEGFRDFTPKRVLSISRSAPITIIVLRTMLGFTPPEWAYVTTQRTKIDVNQGYARTLDRNIRMDPLQPLNLTKVTAPRVHAMIETACGLLREGVPTVAPDQLHRLDKPDTREGFDSLIPMTEIGVPYAMLLYERFLGRPFAGHRDSVSELVGDILESAIEDALSLAGISFRKTKRAERIPGFDQSPDFIIPSEFNPQVVIEAKITEDDGTARDKVTRVQHLGEIANANGLDQPPKFEVVACIAGRGFGVRREDMKKLLLATRGKVFTLQNMNRLVACTRLKEFETRH